MYLDWSRYSDQTLCAQWETVVVGVSKRFTCIQLGSTAKAHCALWGQRQKDRFNCLANSANKPTVHYEIWRSRWRVFWLSVSTSLHPSVQLREKVTHKDAFVASSTARRILPAPDLSHHFRIWALHLLMAVLGSNSKHASKEILTQEKIWLGVAGLL